MAALDDVLSLLTGLKVYDSATGKWRIYDGSGNELADPGGVLQRGLHGFLLHNQQEQVARRFARDKKVLITINGARFLVPEDQVDKWLETKEDKVVADLTAPKKVRGKPIALPVKLNTEKIRAIEAPDYIRDRIAAVNKRIEQRIRIYNESLEEEEELLLCLM